MKMETLVEQTKWRMVIGRGELLLAKAGGVTDLYTPPDTDRFNYRLQES